MLCAIKSPPVVKNYGEYFLIGRHLSQNWPCQQMNKYPKFQAIDLAVAKEGWKIVLLTRLSPVFPFNLLNYLFGVTQVSLKDYILGSFGIIPGTVMYVYISSLAGNMHKSDPVLSQAYWDKQQNPHVETRFISCRNAIYHV